MLAELGFADGADAQTVHWIVSHPEMEVFVAADGMDKPIGLLSMSYRPQLRLRGRIATIDELVVSASWRRKGVGRELLRRAVERARVLAVKRLELTNHFGRGDEAMAFYRACGFVERDAVVFQHLEG